MNFILIIIIGVMLAGIINFFAYSGKKEQSLIQRYLDSLYGDNKCLLTQAVLITISILLYRSYGLSIQYASYILLSAILTAAAIVDVQKQVIPDILVIISLVIGTLMIFLNPELSLLRSVLGALLAGGILLFISVISKGSLEIGDVKLFTGAGLFLGIENGLSALLISAVLSGLAGLVLIVKSVSDRKKTMPFAPFILAGVLITILM